MDNYIAPDIPGYAQSIVKKTIGAQTEIKSIEWSAGGLYNKVYIVHTTDGEFVLKIECNKIFPTSRTGQMENEVEGNRLCKQAGIPCPNVLAYDFSGREIGVRYIFIERISGDIVLVEHDGMDDETKAEVQRQTIEICTRISAMTNSNFGSLTPSGPLGWHKTWGECYRAWFDLLIRDSIGIGLFTDEELVIVRAAAKSPIRDSVACLPTFEHGDLGWHNMIWGHTNNQPDALHVIDFGNARYLLPHYIEHLARNVDMLGRPPFAIPELYDLDKGFNSMLVYEFESMMWKEMQKLTQDYAHCTDWMAAGIEASKKDTSRDHVISFVERCRVL